jgi:hypothetical protein
MASGDNPRLPLTAASSAITKYTEMRNQTSSPSTMITISDMPTGGSTSASHPQPYRLHKQASLPINEYELRRLPTQQRRIAKKTLMSNVGYRLAKRKQLHIER